jgi:hypothetical protein
MLQAWPWSPDTLAMSTWIAAEENEPDALAMLAGAARQPGVSISSVFWHPAMLCSYEQALCSRAECRAECSCPDSQMRNTVSASDETHCRVGR